MPSLPGMSHPAAGNEGVPPSTERKMPSFPGRLFHAGEPRRYSRGSELIGKSAFRYLATSTTRSPDSITAFMHTLTAC